jgi:hypothetical protein
MHGAILNDIAKARHADLVREAALARGVIAAQRNRKHPPAVRRWRVRALLIDLRRFRRVLRPAGD